MVKSLILSMCEPCVIIGICGGMPAGRTNHVTINISDLESLVEAGKLAADKPVDLDALKACGAIKATGKRRNLPLKVLGSGDISKPLNVRRGPDTGNPGTQPPPPQNTTNPFMDRYTECMHPNPFLGYADFRGGFLGERQVEG